MGRDAQPTTADPTPESAAAQASDPAPPSTGPLPSVQAVLDALPAMVGYWDRDLRNRLANAAYVEFFGRRPEEMREIHIRELLGPDLYEKNLPYIEAALAGDAQLFDRAIRTPSGELRYTQASYIPHAVDGVVQGFFVLVTDITERQRIEEEVERSRARLAEAERVARLGSWEWDIASNHITWSEGLIDVYGIGPDALGARYRPGGSELVHPEDRQRVDAAVRRAVETGAPIDLEYRIIRPDGRVRRLHGRAELIADPAGRPLRLTGTAQDITDVRATAEALSRTAAELGRHAAGLHRVTRPEPSATDDLSRALTARQLEVLALVARGDSNAEIARRLFLSEGTVKWHVRKILRALGATNRAQAVARYLAARRPASE